MMKGCIICIVAAWCLFPPVKVVAREEAVTIEIVTTFEYPGFPRGTYPYKINEAGDVAGSFADLYGVLKGFVRYHDDTFSDPIVEPDPIFSSTRVFGINNVGMLCGSHQTRDYIVHGFLLANRIFTDFEIADAYLTQIRGLNDAGNFCGLTESNTGNFGFVNIGGTSTLFSVPGANITDALGMNNLNQCVGTAVHLSSSEGFLRDEDGTLTTPIRIPNARRTTIMGINDAGWMVGFYQDEPRLYHAFFLQSHARFVTYDYPDEPNTVFTGINGRGLISGYWYDKFHAEGFIAQVTLTPP